MNERKQNPISRFMRWLFGSPFRRLPAAYGNPVPSDLQVFEAQADEAEHQGLGGVAAEGPHTAPEDPAGTAGQFA